MIEVRRPGFPKGYTEAKVSAALAAAGYTLAAMYGDRDVWRFHVETTEANRAAVEAAIDGTVDTTSGVAVAVSPERTPVVLTGQPGWLSNAAGPTTLYSWSIAGGLRGLEITLPFHYFNNTGGVQDLILAVRYGAINLLNFAIADIAASASDRAGFLDCHLWNYAPGAQAAVSRLQLAAPTTGAVETHRMNDYFGDTDSTIQQRLLIIATLGAASLQLYLRTGVPLVRYL